MNNRDIVNRASMENTTIMCAKCMRAVDQMTIDYDMEMGQYIYAVKCHGSHEIARVYASDLPSTGYLGIAFGNEFKPQKKEAIEAPPIQIEEQKK